MAKFKYRSGPRTQEEIDRQSRGSGYDRYIRDEFKTFKAKEGDNTVRILPPTWEDTKTWDSGWHITIALHYNVGPDNGSYLCAKKVKGEECPICDAVDEAKHTGDEDTADKLRASDRALAWIIDRDRENEGPQVFSMPFKKVFKEIQSRALDRRSGSVITIEGYEDEKGEPQPGYDITFMREGTDVHSDYTGVQIARDPSWISEDQKQEDRWLQYIKQHPLPEVLQFYDADYLTEILYGKRSAREEAQDGGRELPSRRPLERDEGQETRRALPREAAADASQDAQDERGDPPWRGEGEERRPLPGRSGGRGAPSRGEPDPEPQDEGQEQREAEASARAGRNNGRAPTRGRPEAAPDPRPSTKRSPAPSTGVAGARKAAESLKSGGRTTGTRRGR